ncbi:MAG: phenylalanyl-tRNA synthetase subunit beta, partial [Chloroflexi bacterium]|nr:phenylalanyl-tRNA synthetase subunit beta [Chloroflexota bacterium]
MRVPLRWLREYVECDLSTDEIARLLTNSGTEVGHVVRVGAGWDRIVIGRVLDVGRHQNADNLFVARIDVGDGELTLVTAAPNLKSGDVVPVIRSGGELGPDRRVEGRRFRGIMSEGMLCSGDELDISTDKDSIYVLEAEAPIGVDARDYLGDDVLDIELTPNRPDCLGIVGIAREVAALTGARLRLPEAPPIVGTKTARNQIRVFVDDPDLCPRYTASFLDGVRVGASPSWLQRRLHLAGMRSVSNVVDVTNYVMLELGQPLHAFDARLLGEATIRVRRARPGETMVTIDGVVRQLPVDSLVIADASRPIALAGIMGSQDSEISDATEQVVIESATFDRLSVRRTSQALRLTTEASKRFDKGLDVNLPPFAAQRAMSLLMELSGGTTADGLIDVHADGPAPSIIRFAASDITGLIGQDYSQDMIEDVLGRLGFTLEHRDGLIEAAVPSWRHDVEGRADIAEEIARIIGYDAIPVTLPSGSLPKTAEDPTLRWEEVLRSALAAHGLQEVKTYSLVDPQAVAKLDVGFDPGPQRQEDSRHPLGAADSQIADSNMIPLFNPMSSEQSRLRTTLLPSILSSVGANLRYQRRVGIFEIARVYLPPLDPLPIERRRLTVALAGRRAPEGWASSTESFDFFDLRGVVEAALRAIHGPSPIIAPATAPWLHPSRGASLRVTDEGPTIGLLGQVHP